AVVGDMHVCSLPPNAHQPTVSAFPSGSGTVMFGGRPALRTTDTCICGAMAVVGAPTVSIG
ncbi:MAG TPA: PAAR domain-containing protein, partial [Burkholderiaceae bacterium]